MGVEKTEAAHVFDHVVLPHERGDLGEGDVAGVGQRLFKGLGIVFARAVDLDPGDIALALAVEAALLDVGDSLDRGGRRHQLEDRAGDEDGGQGAVDKGALSRNGVWVGRVDRRGGDHAHELAGFVVCDEDAALLPVQRGVGGVVEPRVDIEPRRGGGGAGGAGEQRKALHPVPVGGEDARACAPPVVAGHVVAGRAGQRVGGIEVFVGREGGQHDAVAVEQLAGGAGVEAVEGQRPVRAVVDVAQHIGGEADDDQRGQQQDREGPAGDLFHASSASSSSGSSGGGALRIRSPGRTAKLASRRLSAPLMKAIIIQQLKSEEPPRETKGKVTPVKGRMSSEPKTLSASCVSIMLVAAQAAML